MKAWSKNGRYVDETLEHSEDIIGMYPKTRIINGFEVPAPETTEPSHGNNYFYPCPSTVDFYARSAWEKANFDKRSLKRGLVFLNKEDAIANAKAMLGINPHEES